MSKVLEFSVGVVAIAVFLWFVGYFLSIFNTWSFQYWNISEWGSFGRTLYGFALLVLSAACLNEVCK